MRKRWIVSLALSLGFLSTTAQAGQDPWRSSAPPATATIGRPVAVDANAPALLPPLLDNQVRPTAFESAPVISDPLIRTQATDVARPLPTGTPASGSTTAAAPAAASGSQYSSWKRPDDNAGPPPLTAPGGSGNSLGRPIAYDGGALPASHGGAPAPDLSLWGRLCQPFTDCGDACPVNDCTGGGVNCGNGCCYNPGNCFYVSAEGLIWWMKGNHVPALVTTGSAADAVPGALGQPGTQVLFGNGDLNGDATGGGRFMVGYWFTRDHCIGLEGGGFFLGSNTTDFSASSQGNPPLFRPFTDETGAQNVELVAVPSPGGGPGLAGTVSVNSRTSLWGAEANLRSNLFCGPCWFIDGLLGFRALGLDDDLNIHESLQYVRGATIPDRGITVPAGTTFEVNDHFQTKNRFYGGQIGLDWECRKGNWIFDLKTKLGIGATNQSVDISGNTVIAVPGLATANYNGGLLAQGSNIGHYSRDVFSVVPEVGFNIGYQFNQHWRGYVGYNVIYWTNVQRSGNAIDTVVNRNQLPPPVGTGSNPAFQFHNTDFWAQGINLGLEFKW